ncbi:LOW QUALITY PROTEIN: hypothetical protein HID58_035583, partial [Brassica napus]
MLRDRRKKINSLFSSLRSSLPTLDQSVSNYSGVPYILDVLKECARNLARKLSISETNSRGLKYIPEVHEQAKKLLQNKEELLINSGIEHYVKPQPKAVSSYISTVPAWRQRSDGPNFIVQLIHNFSISNVLTGLEEDGVCSCGCFIFKVARGKAFLH